MDIDFAGLIKIKIDHLEKIKVELSEVDVKKQKLTQEGVELQGAIKQLNELLLIQQQEKN